MATASTSPMRRLAYVAKIFTAKRLRSIELWMEQVAQFLDKKGNLNKVYGGLAILGICYYYITSRKKRLAPKTDDTTSAKKTILQQRFPKAISRTVANHSSWCQIEGVCTSLPSHIFSRFENLFEYLCRSVGWYVGEIPCGQKWMEIS